MPAFLRRVAHRSRLGALKTLMRLGPRPQRLLFTGPGSALQLCDHIADGGARRLLLVSDATLVRLGLLQPLQAALHAKGVACAVFDGIEPDPTHEQVSAGAEKLHEHGAEAVLAVGGGSALDAAKIIAALATNRVTPSDLVGAGKIKQQPLPLYAVPTTAGTGSEVTAVAVATDTAAKRKTMVIDRRLVPRLAALDATLMTGMPASVTAAGGMDALTHAIESCVSGFADEESLPLSRLAVKLIFGNLARAYEEGSNVEARQAMAMAAMYAGLAFSRASVGYVHAIAHQLGALYHVPHGLANAMLLAPVLEFSLAEAEARLAELALEIGAGERGQSQAELAAAFVSRVRDLSRRVGIPQRVEAMRDRDVDEIAARALDEAHGFYPVPRLMDQADCRQLLRSLLPGVTA